MLRMQVIESLKRRNKHLQDEAEQYPTHYRLASQEHRSI